jgi:hypothetical protein
VADPLAGCGKLQNLSCLGASDPGELHRDCPRPDAPFGSSRAMGVSNSPGLAKVLRKSSSTSLSSSTTRTAFHYCVKSVEVCGGLFQFSDASVTIVLSFVSRDILLHFRSWELELREKTWSCGSTSLECAGLDASSSSVTSVVVADSFHGLREKTPLTLNQTLLRPHRFPLHQRVKRAKETLAYDAAFFDFRFSPGILL